MSENIIPLNRAGAKPEPFNDTIHVAGATVKPWHLADGTLTVELDHGDEGGIQVLSLEAACALAAALQAVAVHQMEQQPRELVRSTEPGAPSFEEGV